MDRIYTINRIQTNPAFHNPLPGQKSFTARDAKAAKEQKSLTAKGAIPSSSSLPSQLGRGAGVRMDAKEHTA